MVADSPYSRVMRELSIRRRYGRPSRDYPDDPTADLDRICAEDRAFAGRLQMIAFRAVGICFLFIAAFVLWTA